MSVQWDERDAVAVVRIAGPHHNALNQASWLALSEVFSAIARRTSVRCVVLEGDGGHFAAGADIGEFPKLRGDLASVRHYHEQIIAPALLAISSCPVPVIAKIRGDCIGGGLEIAACCDLRYAAASARFGVPIGRLGFAMAPDELSVLVQLVGRANAAELLFEGRLISADEARQRNMLTRMSPDDELDAAVGEAVSRIKSQAPLAMRINKTLLRQLAQGPLSIEQRSQAFGYAETNDHREGIAAFLERRVPQFNFS